MKCLFCQNGDTDVVETRISDDQTTVRRRRECVKCLKRFTTYERVEQLPIIVIKRDKRREKFDRDKLKKGILASCGKTILTLEEVEDVVSQVEADLKQEDSIEIESRRIGNLVAEKLKKKDKVAYIRFASVFRRFVDVEEFNEELKKIM
jgi:transcriptional repressor NrdR